jgi:hypothetical protein
MWSGGFNMVEGEEAWMPLHDVIAFVETAQHCHRERAEQLVSAALDAGHVSSRTVEKGEPLWHTAIRGGSEIVYSDHGRRIEVLREDVLRLWQKAKELPAAPKAVPERARPVEEGVLEAIRALWPNGILRGLKAKQRDNAIHKWLKTNGKSVGIDPSPSLSRAVQRVLKAHPELLLNDPDRGRSSEPATGA